VLGDLTVIVGPGDTIDVTTLENPSIVGVAPATSTADVRRVTFTTMLEEGASELLPKRYARLKKNSGVKRINN